MSAERAPAGGAGRTLAVALGLGVFAALAVVLGKAALVSDRLSVAEALSDWLEVAPLPFGLEPDGALRRGGELLVRWIDRGAPPEAPRAEPPRAGEQEPKQGPRPPREFDWSAIPIGPEGTPPVEVLLARYPEGSSERVERLFAPPPVSAEPGGELTVIGPEGGRVAMDRGRLRWGAFEVAFVLERELEAGGTFRDVIRANLSLPRRPLVLYARWPRGLPASEERMVELLAAFRPASVPGEGS
jgi:hypothetical protein